MGNVLTTSKRLLRIYLIFAVVHHLVKLVRFARNLIRARILWKNIPGYGFDLTMSEVRKNMNRLNDWRVEKIAAFPDAPFVKFNGSIIYCAKPETVEWMLKTEFPSITKPGPDDLMFGHLRTFIGDKGIFSLRHGESPELKEENRLWYHQRKTASLIFTKNKFKNLMHDTFSENVQGLLERLDQYSQKGGRQIDIQSQFFAFTMDSIQNIFFGRKVDSFKHAEDDAFATAFDTAHRNMVKHTLKSIPAFVMSRLFLPFPFGDIFDISNTSILHRRRVKNDVDMVEFRESVRKLDEMAYKIIETARKDPEIENRRDMLALFLSSKAEFTDRELRDIILNMTIAGRDTTACTLSWTVYMLSQNPEVEQKLCEEIDEKLGDRVPTFEDITPENMPYLNGVLYESLRLHPPVPIDTKVVAKDVEYYDGTKFPAGTKLSFSPYAMGRDPNVYPDPLKCDPERWIPFKMPNQYAFPVFQAGPRFCLGKDMAQFEAKFVLASIYKRFKLKLLEGEAEKITYARALTMSVCNSKKQDSHNLWVIPVKR